MTLIRTVLIINGYKPFHVVRSVGIRGGVSLFVRNNIAFFLMPFYGMEVVLLTLENKE